MFNKQTNRQNCWLVFGLFGILSFPTQHLTAVTTNTHAHAHMHTYAHVYTMEVAEAPPFIFFFFELLKEVWISISNGSYVASIETMN